MNGRPDFPQRRFTAPRTTPPREPLRRHHPQARDPETSPIPAVSTQPRRPAPPEFTTSRGELPIPSSGDDRENAETAGARDPGDIDPGLAEQPTVRRKKVSLTEPARNQDTEEARVYTAPPPNGLGKFDLGSVPASVTPPRTWRKAAWFATLSSGAVVIALLVAGTALVGQPKQPQQAALEGWPDRHGGAPMLPGGGYTEDRASTPEENSATQQSHTDSRVAESTTGNVSVGLRLSHPSHPGNSPLTGTDSSGAGEATSTATPSTAPSSGEPQKPPVTPAPTKTAEQVHLLTAYDADTLAERSQEYLNTVTEDPEAAHELTTGELASAGPEGLRERYSGIAYVEVRHVYIDQNEGYTLNKIEVTYEDGTKAEQTRKLVFEANKKISSDTN